jgi:diaminopimelate decarboxylase
MELVNGQYSIQGVVLTELCSSFGSPLYVYDGEKIVSQIQRLKQAFEGVQLRIKYAAKALTNISVLKLVRKAGAGLDVVSLEEAQIGLMAGFQPEEILFTPNSVAFSEIQKAIDMGLVINIDNIAILEEFGHQYGNTVPCCLRLNPHIVAGGNVKIQTGHIDSKFGISILQLRHVLRVIKTYNIHVVGLHVHTGSDFLDADVFLKGAELIFEAAADFPDLQFLDFGSGFKVAYKEDDITTNIEELGQRMTQSFKAFCKSYGRELEIWFEPGKFIVSEAGLLLVTANTIKTTLSSVFVGVNSGLNHLLRPMMYDAYHEIINLSNPTGTKRIYTVVGYICETDTLGYDRKLSEVKEGDILAIKNAGAYGFSMSSNYNSRPRPAEVLIWNGKAQLIRRRETLEDIIKTQVEVEI